MWGRFAALVRKEILVLIKDWHGLMVLFLMPTAFVLIMSIAMQDAFGDHGGPHVAYAVLNKSREGLPPGLLDRLQDIPGFRAVLLPAASPLDNLNAGISRGDYQLAVVIPPDFHRRLIKTAGGDPAALPASVELLAAPTVKPYVRQLFDAALRAILIRQKIAWLLNATPGANAPPVVTAAALDQFSQLNIGERYVYAGPGTEAHTPNAVQQNVPAWLVFSMFFVVIPLSTVLLTERQQGTLLRLRVMHVGALPLLLGKLIPYFAVNQLQMLVLVAVGMDVVPLLSGQPLNPAHSVTGLVLISSACSVAAIGFALLVATLVRTTMQATVVGGVVNIIFGALGGIMVPKFVMPAGMQTLTDLSPMAWGLDGFLDVFLLRSGWQAVLPQALRLTIFGILCLGAAAYRFKKEY